ncbi:heavy metal translocating P-type ATPase [Pseudolysinimonas kribbensis]|uniref:Cobalt ABC transporter ATP-binding protein n=1 Tax=Pseudolysinimonas kribbensis TaxID=433641 RepID=A0ABQ6K9L3_9MICO|nr:heavy metal translocating P-type ATPase [Pseudolysinimonas kribbensis]GMA96938.1 cobalt ABC transporter ATP-binding protein [Pseudolysinimonas kribbensis]
MGDPLTRANPAAAVVAAPVRRRRIPLTWSLAGGTALIGAVAGTWQLTLGPGGVPWILGTLAAGVAGWRLIRMISDIRSQRWGIDVLAVLAVASTMVVGEWWAAWVITLMMTGGDALEDFASRRAHREIQSLMERAPRQAFRVLPDGSTVEVLVDEVAVGDVVLVRPGDLVPVDGTLLEDRAAFDLSSVSGESLPETLTRGAQIPSGAVATTVPARVACTAPARLSEYQRIVDAVGAAAGSRSRFVRLSDRIAVPFTVVALLIAAAAWLITGEFLRFAEVLVVATPCPLLIAAPAAFVAGMGRTARAGLVAKNAEVLERIAAVRTAAFDKTGTLTGGAPMVAGVEPADGVDADRLLALAAAAESLSAHALAAPIVAAAAERGLRLPALSAVAEVPGDGMRAKAEGAELRVGSAAFTGAPLAQPIAGVVAVTVSLGGRGMGRILLRDPLRSDAAATIAGLHEDGIEQIVMLTGDDAGTARAVAALVGIDRFDARLRPEQKAAVVKELLPRPVLMVGDGINDVLVLASADVGVAVSRSGLGAVGESADAVIVTDRLGALLDARRIARRTRRIARQSVWFGVLVSVGLMAVATTGVLPPIFGALAQEAVDVLTILNALRAARAPQ